MALKLDPVNVMCNILLLKLDLYSVIFTAFFFSGQVLIKSFKINRNRHGESDHEPTQGRKGENTVAGLKLDYTRIPQCK